MRPSTRPAPRARRFPLLAGGIGAALALTACGGSSPGSGAASGGDLPATSGEIDCAPLQQFGDIAGEEVELYTSIVTPEDTPYIDSFKPFEECTGATVQYNGSREFEAQLPVRIESGSAPDLALLPQPGLLQRLVRDTDAVVPAPDQVEANVDEFWAESWKQYGTVDGEFYAAPSGANLKSLVWYSPTAFADAGYEVPQTFEEMITLSEQVVTDGGTPWCAGAGSGDATGWVLTDWLEDVVLHKLGPDVYDQWVSHEIPFNDPQIAAALADVGTVLKNPEFVNGGLGDVPSIATTQFTEGGLPILDGNCFLHRQASFYQVNFTDAGAELAEDGEVFAFPFPVMNDEVGNAALGGGEFTTAFSDRPAVQALQTYMSSDQWANEKARVSGSGWISANTGLDPANLESPIDRVAYDQLADESVTFRFDASDLAPAAVGAGAEWRELTEWIATDKDDQAVLDAVEAAWPS